MNHAVVHKKLLAALLLATVGLSVGACSADAARESAESEPVGTAEQGWAGIVPTIFGWDTDVANAHEDLVRCGVGEDTDNCNPCVRSYPSEPNLWRTHESKLIEGNGYMDITGDFPQEYAELFGDFPTDALGHALRRGAESPYTACVNMRTLINKGMSWIRANQNTPDIEDYMFKVGAITHTLQDSYAPAHARRDSASPPYPLKDLCTRGNLRLAVPEATCEHERDFDPWDPGDWFSDKHMIPDGDNITVYPSEGQHAAEATADFLFALYRERAGVQPFAVDNVLDQYLDCYSMLKDEDSTPGVLSSQVAGANGFYLRYGPSGCLTAQADGSLAMAVCADSASQRFKSTADHQLQNIGAGRCLHYDRNPEGVRLAPCEATRNQQWVFTWRGGLVNRMGKCIDAPWDGMGGALLRVKNCNLFAADEWNLNDFIKRARYDFEVSTCSSGTPPLPSNAKAFTRSMSLESTDANVSVQVYGYEKGPDGKLRWGVTAPMKLTVHQADGSYSNKLVAGETQYTMRGEGSPRIEELIDLPVGVRVVNDAASGRFSGWRSCGIKMQVQEINTSDQAVGTRREYVVTQGPRWFGFEQQNNNITGYFTMKNTSTAQNYYESPQCVSGSDDPVCGKWLQDVTLPSVCYAATIGGLGWESGCDGQSIPGGPSGAGFLAGPYALKVSSPLGKTCYTVTATDGNTATACDGAQARPGGGRIAKVAMTIDSTTAKIVYTASWQAWYTWANELTATGENGAVVGSSTHPLYRLEVELFKKTIDAVHGFSFGPIVQGGYNVYNTETFSTPLADLTSKLGLDVYVPGALATLPWVGAVQLYATCTGSDMINAYIGQVELTGKPADVYTTLEFPIPSNVLTGLQASHPSCFFSVALNTPATAPPPQIKDLRFLP